MGRFDLQPRKPKKSVPPPSPPQRQPQPEPPTQTLVSRPKVRPAKGRPASPGQTFMRGFWRGAIVFIAISIFVVGAGIIAMAIIAGPLPQPDELAKDASK